MVKTLVAILTSASFLLTTVPAENPQVKIENAIATHVEPTFWLPVT
jgi:hypothetical protein